ncbi:MAG: arylamine N-acetyltransferase [Nodosilinea sp.]
MNAKSPDTIDLDAYFQRIGYSANPAPSLDTLRAIHHGHTQAIAFENLSPLLGEPVLLDLPSLQQKLILAGRGGYCFEQNLLFRAVLVALGFEVTSLAARVLWGVPEEVVTPRTHMVLMVSIDGEPYIADVGFGGLTLTTPLRLKPNLEQPTSHEPFRLIETDQAYTLQAHINQGWTSLYRFDRQEQHLVDYDVSNWYVSTHPNSLFVNSLVAARPDATCRYALRNNHFAIHHLNGSTEKYVLTTAEELRAVLENEFRLVLPKNEWLEKVLTQVVYPS